jgi:hypothetical protein
MSTPSEGRGAQIPERFRQDLYGAADEGANDPTSTAGEADGTVAARNVKDIYRRLPDWNDADLGRVPVLQEGVRLEQGATYLDLQNPERGEFKAMGGMRAGPENFFVPKRLTDYEVWDRLVAEARSTMR